MIFLQGIRLSFAVSLLGYFVSYAILFQSRCAIAQPALAEVEAKGKNREIIELSEFESPVTNIDGLLSQSPTPTYPPATQGEVVTITGVKANPTEKGVEVILETSQGDKLQVANRSTGNNFIADITGGQLRLPNGDAFTFKSEKPLAGIIEITVANIDANTVRVTVVGEKSLPTVELFDDNAGLVFAVASAATATQPPQTPEDQQKPASETPQQEPTAQQSTERGFRFLKDPLFFSYCVFLNSPERVAARFYGYGSMLTSLHLRATRTTLSCPFHG